MARIFTVACVVALLIADFGDSTLAGVISVEGDTGDGQVYFSGPITNLSDPIVRVGAGSDTVRASPWCGFLNYLNCLDMRRLPMQN